MSRLPAQVSYPPLSFPPTIPNPNPNLFQTPPQNTQPEILTPPPPDLSTTISSLSSLIRESCHTIESLSTLLPLQSQNDAPLIPCPVDPNHRVHPHSLFSHSLRCQSYSQPLHRLLPMLNYPNTLKSSDQVQTDKSFAQPQHGSEADLCLSLDHYYAEFGASFFYRDCPGAVNFSAPDGSNKTFSLPLVLSVECANFSGGEEREMVDCENKWSRMLPSELWAVKTEIQGWNEYPGMYSNCVLRAILGLGLVRECDLGIWVITNSPKHGVVIDLPMRDHISFLISLCLKAIFKEALSKVKNGDSDSRHYECPTLLKAFMWLASQFSVLYGELNGKLFSINILKHCIQVAALGSLIFPLEEKVVKPPALKDGSLNVDVGGNDVRDHEVVKPLSTEVLCGKTNEMIIKKVVFVSQVAAAVAALHERSLLEEKVRGERVSKTLPRHQRVVEHDYVSQRADEERKKRSQYRPIIDHDGLPRQPSSDQETNKTKTREELLAEERDYKRRRMSYRGKKVKRTTLQVTRDIIEEYMEEIKQAGGIGCFEQRTEGKRSFPFELSSAPDISSEMEKPTKRNNDSEGGSPSRTRKQSHYGYDIHSTTSKEASAKDKEKSRRSYVEDQRSLSRDKRDTANYSRSPDGSRNHGWSRGQTRHGRERDHSEVTNTKDRESNRSSKYHDNGSSSHSNYHQKYKAKRDKNTYENHSSKSPLQNAFDDRYNPADSHDRYEDDLSTKKTYARADKYSGNKKNT